LIGLVLLLGSCAVARSSERSATAKWAQTVAALRRSADAYVQTHELELAAADLHRIFSLEVPKDAPPKAYQLLQDAHFALGSVLLLQARFDGALKEADLGLALGDDHSIFGANLHALRGLAREGQGRPLDALQDYANAMEIHKTLFDAALEAHDAAPDPANTAAPAHTGS